MSRSTTRGSSETRCYLAESSHGRADDRPRRVPLLEPPAPRGSTDLLSLRHESRRPWPPAPPPRGNQGAATASPRGAVAGAVADPAPELDDLRSSAALAVAPPQSSIGASAFRPRAAAVPRRHCVRLLLVGSDARLRLCAEAALFPLNTGEADPAGRSISGAPPVTRTGRRSRRVGRQRLARFAGVGATLDAVGQLEETRGCIRCGPLIFRRRHVVEACRVVLRDVLV